MYANIGKRQAVSSVSSQSRSVIGNVGQPLESRCKQLQFKNYFQFWFGGRHLASVVHNVRRHRGRHGQVGRDRKCGGRRWNSVCMSLETEVTSTSRKTSIFSRRVPLVFQVAPGTGKNYVQAENAETPGIGPTRNRF